MTLPVPNLDNRRFQDLVDEAKQLIPTFCPEWTNHNVADPGVALIELFAWMTELTLYQLNQVPDAFYAHMLNLYGYEPFGPTAARADLTFYLGNDITQPVEVPRGTRVGTSGGAGEVRVFTTLDDLSIRQPGQPIAALASGDRPPYNDVLAPLLGAEESVACFEPLRPGACLHLGFAESLAGNVLRLRLDANKEGLGVNPDWPPIRWEVSQGQQWGEAETVNDTTGGMNRSGTIELRIPSVHEKLRLDTYDAYWLRVQLLAPLPRSRTRGEQPTYRQSPEIRQLTVTSLGGTVVAEHSDVSEVELVGLSTGQPGQRFVLRNRPVLAPDPSAGETVQVVSAGTVEDWQVVDDFSASGPEDHHVVWDLVGGAIAFGPRIRRPERDDDDPAPAGSTYRQHGAVPPKDARIFVTRYRHGGGRNGNVGAGTITEMRGKAISGIGRVVNAKGASGGVDAEPVEQAKERAPLTLRSGYRAVTTTDFERLARMADPSLARVRCLPRAAAHEPVRLLLVPSVDRPDEDLALDDLELGAPTLARVKTFLDERRLLGTSLEIGPASYVGVTVVVLLTAAPNRQPDWVRDRAAKAIYRYLSPFEGGDDGEGWPWETDLNAASIVPLLKQVEGVRSVERVEFYEYDLRNKVLLPEPRDRLRLRSHELFLSTQHRVYAQ